ncbi:ASST-domain-containing protein [Coniella lustricola]|uniref:ASST-domain-containing protein n=1 Tax=Coniella lustricola TaxID=2025994 RepID=A0A2T3A652_9PEZI|nr:ASST-domain-containing protein [Coniella lustricola]
MLAVSPTAAVLGALAAGAGLAAADEFPRPYVTDYMPYNEGFYGTHPNQSFKTTNTFAPLFQVNQWDPSRSGLSRYLFVSNPAGTQQSSPFIIDTKDFSMVYGDPTWSSVNNPRIQEYNGLPYFTFWEGRDFSGHGLGHCLLYDSSYQQVFNVSVKMVNTEMDSHECQLTHDGTALVTAYEKIPYDMRNAPGGGPSEGQLLDSIFEEIDVATGDLKFLWRASDHFDINNTEVNWGPDDYGAKTEDVGWDFFHINSLQKTKAGNYLVSGRRISSLIHVSGQDGSVLWQLGGKDNQFYDLSGGNATNFGFQHTARFLNDDLTELTLFDNHDLDPGKPSPSCPNGCSRGLHLRLNYDDPKNYTVEVVHEYYHPMRIASWAMGGFQKLDNGNVLVSWGTTPAITEYTEDGEIVMDVQLGPWIDEVGNREPVYRAWTMNWTAYPTWNPSVAAGDGYAYVSWNGATEVDSWDIMEGDTQSNITFTGNVKKVGYETVVPLKTSGAFVVANALAADGTVLGTTDVWDMELGATVSSWTQNPSSFPREVSFAS